MANEAATPLVLLVEDYEDARDMYTQGLKFAGFEVLPCADAHDAIGMPLAASVDLVVLDYSMPGMDGAELALRLKAQAATAQARYVLLTGHGPDALRAAAQKVHFDAMVRKPVAPDQLVRVLRKLLAS